MRVLGNVAGIEILYAQICHNAQHQGQVQDAEINAIQVFAHHVLHYALYSKQVGGFDHQVDEQEKKEIGEEFAFHASAVGALICGAKVAKNMNQDRMKFQGHSEPDDKPWNLTQLKNNPQFNHDRTSCRFGSISFIAIGLKNSAFIFGDVGKAGLKANPCYQRRRFCQTVFYPTI